jgi:hypothetical protein
LGEKGRPQEKEPKGTLGTVGAGAGILVTWAGKLKPFLTLKGSISKVEK